MRGIWAAALLMAVLAPAPAAAQSRLSDIVADAEGSVVTIDAGDATGAGFALGGPGVLYTDSDVVGGADRVEIVDSRGRGATADVVARDEGAHVARLATQLDLTPLKRAARDAKPGDQVVTIAVPGQRITVTTGTVSAIGEGTLQTDLAVPPGGSGGPLLDSRGRVLGIISDLQGQGAATLAIPIDEALAAVGRSSARPAPEEQDGSLPLLAIALVLALAAGAGALVLAWRRQPPQAPVTNALPAATVTRREPSPTIATAEEEPLIIVRHRKSEDRTEEPWT